MYQVSYPNSHSFYRYVYIDYPFHSVVVVVFFFYLFIIILYMYNELSNALISSMNSLSLSRVRLNAYNVRFPWVYVCVHTCEQSNNKKLRCCTKRACSCVLRQRIRRTLLRERIQLHITRKVFCVYSVGMIVCSPVLSKHYFITLARYRDG